MAWARGQRAHGVNFEHYLNGKFVGIVNVLPDYTRWTENKAGKQVHTLRIGMSNYHKYIEV
jgi:hypothetical protein